MSQVHQQSKKCTNREGVPSARLVQLRQLHPLGVLPQNSRNIQNFLLRKSPTEFAEYTELSAEKNSHRFHRFTQILLARRFCVFCGSFCILMYSVKSVGVFIFLCAVRSPQPCEGERSVDHEQLVAEAVTPEMLRGDVESVAE